MKNNFLINLSLLSTVSFLLVGCNNNENNEDLKKNNENNEDLKKDNEIITYKFSDIIFSGIVNLTYNFPSSEKLKTNNHFGVNAIYYGQNKEICQSIIDYLNSLNDEELSKKELELKNILLTNSEIELKLYELLDENMDQNQQLFIGNDNDLDLYDSYQKQLKSNYKKDIEQLINEYFFLSNDNVDKNNIDEYMSFIYHLNELTTNDIKIMEENVDIEENLNELSFLSLYNLLSEIYAIEKISEGMIEESNLLIDNIRKEKTNDLYKTNIFYREFIDMWNEDVLINFKNYLVNQDIEKARKEFDSFEEVNSLLTDIYNKEFKIISTKNYLDEY